MAKHIFLVYKNIIPKHVWLVFLFTQTKDQLNAWRCYPQQ